MAEELLETVDRLQSRLGDNQEPQKLVKALRRLAELPMTVEILGETGVGKAVNSLRRHDIVGELAKSLVAKWKKLVPQTADRPSNSHHTKPHSHRAEERGHKRTRDPSPELSPEPLYNQDQEEDEDEGYNPNYSPQYSSPERNSYLSHGYNSPQPEPSPPPPPPPPRKEPKQSVKPNKEVQKNHHHSRHRAEEPKAGSSDRREGKKREVERVRHHSPELKAPKQKKFSQETKREEKKSQGSNGRPLTQNDSPINGEEEEEFEAPSMSFESFLTYDAPVSVKKKKKPTLSSTSSSHSRPSHSSSSSSYSRPSAPAAPTPSSSQSSSSSSSSKEKKSNGSSKRPHSSTKSGSSSGVPSEKRKKMVEPVPTLPDIPLPAIQPNYRPLPSIEVTPLSPQRRKVALCNEDEDAVFTGRRLNSKMVVFSGSKTSYLPRMMTLYEQCIRVLQNNIDSIAEVGGVPFEILEPVLERCTPEQLYRIEQSNQWFTEDSDDLWMRHCQRDFKQKQPQEYESWRELYLRLHDEREERLRLLTQKVSSAHANKPKARQVKIAFVNSVVKPPRDVRRRQEKFGTSSGSSASSTAAATSAPIKIRPVFTTEPSEPSCSSSSLSSSSSVPRPSASSGGSSVAASARDKPQVKKIAPMMAKTIKAFKNRFSRR